MAVDASPRDLDARLDSRSAQGAHERPDPFELLGVVVSKQYLTDAQTINLSRLINIVALIGLLGVLAGSLNLQLGVGEQPCPLCLIQRSGMIGLAVGPAMNLLWGTRPRHYALSMLAALVGGAASTRQILLHISDPNDPGYGPAVFGWHLYTWAFVTFLVGVAGMAILLMWNRPFELTDQGVDRGVLGQQGWMRRTSYAIIMWVAYIVFFWVILDLLTIGITVLPECGLGLCSDNPTSGWSFDSWTAWLWIFGLGVVAAIIGTIADIKQIERNEDKEEVAEVELLSE